VTWSGSGIFREWPSQVFQVSGTSYTGLDSDTVKAALFNNTGTPDKDAAVASTGYNTGQWVTANEVTGASEWVAAGRALASKTFTTPSSGVFMFDAADLTGSASVTMSGIQGCLVYDDTISGGTVAKQGVSFNYFGGAQSVTSGTFSVAWNANGVLRFTV
jgi:hypothetical protein